MRLSTLKTILVAVAPVVGAAGAQAKEIGKYNAWTAHQFSEGRAKTCYLHGDPAKGVGNYAKRGRFFVQVTHRPAEGSRDEVGVTAGYTYKKDSQVQVMIGGATFRLFTDRDTAWTADAKTDRSLVRAMMKGREMKVHGVSNRGTKTADTFSLIGFTKAYQSIGRACRVR